MSLTCPRCGATPSFDDVPPSFCTSCGQRLIAPPAEEPLQETFTFPPPAAEPLHEACTLPPPADAPAPASSGTPQAVGGFRLLSTLGSGGMGTVFEAEQDGTGRRVAVKLMSANYAATPDALARFRREAKLASKIVHPRCVLVLKADEEAGRPYIVMELMPGTTLQDVVQTNGPLTVEDAVAKILDVIEGLQAAHRLNVVHRDVKPSNCFLDTDGRVKVGDFGLSKSLAGGTMLTRAGSFMGTPLYASPEQVRCDKVDQQSDLYSTAATLYFLLTRRAPHQTGDPASTMACIVTDDAPPARDTRPELPPELDRVMLRGLERERRKRWPDLEAFRQALLPFRGGEQAAAGIGERLASGWKALSGRLWKK